MRTYLQSEAFIDQDFVGLIGEIINDIEDGALEFIDDNPVQ